MKIAELEHVNITVSDPKATATMLCSIFGWHIRWEGPSMNQGYTVHVGTEASYLAIYSNGTAHEDSHPSYQTRAGLNHIGVVVEDLDAIDKRAKKAGFTPHNYGDYAPGRRFYFHDTDGVEYEVVSYVSAKEVFKRGVTRQLGEMARFGALMR